MSDPIVGIDLGTSNTVVAHAASADTAQILADAGGFKIHPSVVSFHPSGGVVVGAAAKQRKVIDPKNTIFSVKRLIGRSYNSKEVQTAKQRMPYQIKEGANQLPLIVTRGGEFAVPELSAIVLDHAKNVATSALKTEVNRAVVTVPASFNDAQRSATATAGSIAGLSVVRVLNEPTAAALAYGATRNLRETIAVYDFGGGTFDITILKLEDQVYEVLGTSGDSFLGGDDLDERLVDRMVEKFLIENRVDLRTNEVSMMRLRAVAEQTKIELSRRSRAIVRVDEIAYGAKGKALDLQIEIRRDDFVQQVADIIDKTFPVCEEALKLAGLTIDHIDDVILVGGTTKIPYVRDQVTKFFAKAPRTDVNPEEAVAAGAALQATALERILTRKSTSRAPVPAATFDDTEGTFGGESGSNTQTYGGGAGDTLTYGGAPGDTQTYARSDSNAGDTGTYGPGELELSFEPPSQVGKRKTSGYADAPPPARPTQRATTRGEHRDIFEDKTPPPASPNQPAIGRMTKPGMAAPGGPRRTSIGVPIQPPPPPPGATRTAPRVDAQRPPAPTRTMIGQSAADSPTVIVDPSASGDDIGFPNITTEKGFLDLDDAMAQSTQKGVFDLDDMGLAQSTTKGFFDRDDDLPPGATAKGMRPAGGSTAPDVPAVAPPRTTQQPVTSTSPTLVAPPWPPQQPMTSTSPTLIAPPPATLPPELAGRRMPTAPTPVAAVAAAPRPRAPVVLDVTPRGLGIGTVAGFCEELIRRNSRVPTEMRKLFTTSRDDQQSVRIIVVQGESRRMDNNTVIADLRLEDLPRRPRGETSIEVTFALDANGILQVHARDPQTGREQRASLDIIGSIATGDVSASRDKLQALRR